MSDVDLRHGGIAAGNIDILDADSTCVLCVSGMLNHMFQRPHLRFMHLYDIDSLHMLLTFAFDTDA